MYDLIKVLPGFAAYQKQEASATQWEAFTSWWEPSPLLRPADDSNGIVHWHDNEDGRMDFVNTLKTFMTQIAHTVMRLPDASAHPLGHYAMRVAPTGCDNVIQGLAKARIQSQQFHADNIVVYVCFTLKIHDQETMNQLRQVHFSLYQLPRPLLPTMSDFIKNKQNFIVIDQAS
jgi:hypothetical protein